MTNRIDEFVQFTKDYCRLNGVTMESENSRYIVTPDGFKVNGYFDPWVSPPVLKVAMGKSWERWLEILVHEFSHVTQWVERCPEWEALFLGDGSDVGTLLSEWLQGSHDERSTESVMAWAQITRFMEADCDKRALRAIEAFGLPYDSKEYVQRSNAYHLFYLHMVWSRKWYPENKEPYNLKEVWSKMPKKWVDDYHPPERLLKVFRRVYKDEDS